MPNESLTQFTEGHGISYDIDENLDDSHLLEILCRAQEARHLITFLTVSFTI